MTEMINILQMRIWCKKDKIEKKQKVKSSKNWSLKSCLNAQSPKSLYY